MKLFYKYKIFFFLILLNIYRVSSASNLEPLRMINTKKYYVYCANRAKKWHWLKDHNGNMISINGQEYEIKVEKIIIDINEFNYYIKIFRIDNSYETIKELKKMCIEQFGQEYIFVQPANLMAERWKVFSNNEGVFGGHISIFKENSVNIFPKTYELGNFHIKFHYLSDYPPY